MLDSTVLAAIVAACGLPWAAYSLLRLRRMLHILQLEEYETGRFAHWLRAESGRLLPRDPRLLLGLTLALALIAALATLAAGGQAPATVSWIAAALAGGWAVAGALAFRSTPRAEAKKPLVMTPKALVVLAGALGLWLLTVGILAVLGVALLGGSIAGLAAGLVLGVAVATASAPLHVLGTNLVLYPVQGAAKEVIIQAARARLGRSRVRVIGITGSYGKTSTKEILAALLSTRHRVLKTPASFNTPLGISRVILRQLRPEHELLVAEMGAYHQGDIRRLCDIARPTIGILTAVGPQHLERFKSVENVAAAKYELIEALPADGVAIFNADNTWCRELADRTSADAASSRRVVRYGLEARPGLDLAAREVRVTRRGLEFRLVAPGRGEADVRIGLLGRHNVGNFLAAAAAALATGMTLEEVAQAAEKVQPVPHRLQLIQGGGGVTVIDDAYNSNPEGARAALEVLAEFSDSRKVLVTPGMVELGDRELAENRALGEAAAGVCDAVILVGPRRTAPIREGLVAAGFPEDRIIVVRGVSDVPDRLKGLVGPGDVVLFENDLPDNYSEV